MINTTYGKTRYVSQKPINYRTPTGRTDQQISDAVGGTQDRQRQAIEAFRQNRTNAKSDGFNDYASESYFQQALKSGNLPQGVSVSPGTQPTVLSDTTIRDRIIPQLDQTATGTLSRYYSTKDQLQQQKQVQQDRQDQLDSRKDPLSDAFSEKDTYAPDPYTQKQLDLIDRMMQSSDSSTRAAAERQKMQYDQQRQREQQLSAGEQGAEKTSLRRMGSRYTPGAVGQVMTQMQRATNEKLASIDDQEANAMEELRSAQETKDYQLVGQKLDLLKGVRDARIKVLEDARAAEAKVQEQTQKDKTDILKDAAKNGAPADVIAAIAGADDVAGAATAAAEYLQTGEYAEYKRAVKAEGLTPVDANTYYARKIYGENGVPGSDPFTAGDIPFQATIEGAASYAGSVTGEASAKKQLASLAQNGDYPALLTRMEALARKGMGAAPGADVATAQNQIKALSNMSNVLKQYKALGGDMGFLKGNEQTIATRLGQLATDPRFASIATQLTAAYQVYRQNMTGAAFGAKENAEYKSVFPSADKTFELNDAIIDGLKNYYTENVDNAYETQLGEGYTNLKDYVDRGLTPTGKYLLKTEKDALNKVIEMGKQDPGIQQAVNGYMADNPHSSAYDVLQFLGVPVATSNEVSYAGGVPGGNSNKIVGGYDIGSYATDPNHERRVAAIYQKTKDLTDASSVDAYIHRIAPNSPVTGTDVMKAALAKNVTPGMILAIMEQDSTFGTAGKAVRTRNPGNVGNTDSGATKAFPSWSDGVLAVAENLAKRKVG